MRTAYNLRSKMVHSGEVIEKALRIYGGDIPLSTVIHKLEIYTVKAINEVIINKGGFLLFENEHWNERILNLNEQKKTA